MRDYKWIVYYIGREIEGVNSFQAIRYFARILHVLKTRDNFHLKNLNKNEKLWKLIITQIMVQIKADSTDVSIEPTSTYSTAVVYDHLSHKDSCVDSYHCINILSIYRIKKSRRKQLRIFHVLLLVRLVRSLHLFANFPRGLLHN